MPPIPIYSQSPINAVKASGVTPKTDSVADRRAAEPPATRTESGFGPVPPPAQPGAMPLLPQPSGDVQDAGPLRAQYAQPTPTTKTADAGPPPPQPGAVPLPPGARPPAAGGAEAAQHYPQQTSVVPPPPRSAQSSAGGNANATTTLPPQMAIPPLTSASHPYPVPRGTSTVSAQASHGAWPSLPQPTGPTQGTVDQRNLDHPPGYVQDSYATDMSSSQRAAAQASNVAMASHNNSSPGLFSKDEKEEGVWDAAKKYALAAGQRLSAAESEVWRRINKE